MVRRATALLEGLRRMYRPTLAVSDGRQARASSAHLRNAILALPNTVPLPSTKAEIGRTP